MVEALCIAKQARPHVRIVLIVPTGEHNDNLFGQDAQEHYYADYLACGIEVYEYRNHFNHLKIAAFDDRYTVHGSTNLNYRSMEDDCDFELVVLCDSRELATWVTREIRDADNNHSHRIELDEVNGYSLEAMRKRVRDPRTMLLLSRRML